MCVVPPCQTTCACRDLTCGVFSDQWDVQATIKRIVASLKKRGYVVWFGESADGADLERTKTTGSTVGA